MTDAKAELLRALGECVARLAPATALSPGFESPKQAAHGDLAITAAMPLARALKKPPREIAQLLAERLEAREEVKRWVDRIEIAGPGFINLHLRDAARQAVVAEVLAAGERFGTKAPTGEKVLVEFVSANPTGPLHVGHGRNAALGDAIGNLLAAQGACVTREFYYNDAGVQIATLGESVHARLLGLAPGDAGWPEAAYNGDYIADIAADFGARKTVVADDRRFTASGDADDRAGIREFAVASLRHEQDLDLRAFGVRFDVYSLESTLYREGRVEDAVRTLGERGKTFEEGGALWLRTTEYGDDKDRVMRKSDGTYTYFVPDVAYHLDKWRRGFKKAIDVLGTDHHGSLARVRAGVQAAGAGEGIPPAYPEYVLYKMITVMRGGEEVKISKRAGGYVTLRDLVEWTSRDAVRFFLSSRKADTEFVFDVDLALKKNDENPVFYVQYAHARICSVLAIWARDHGGDPASLAGADLSRLVVPAEIALMRLLADYPEMLEAAARSLAPHDVAFYLRSLAAALHSYYAAERFLVDDAGLARARMALLAGCAQVLRNALALLGVGAPEAMSRDAETNGEPAADASGERVVESKAPA